MILQKYIVESWLKIYINNAADDDRSNNAIIFYYHIYKIP